MKPISPVSIIVITHNEEKNISACLDSIALLDYPEFETLVVDSSSDRTQEIVSKYKNVRLIKSEKKGFAVQRNIGVRNAKHDYVAFIDADCIVPEKWLKEMCNFMFSEPNAGAAVSNVYPPPETKKLGLYISCLGYPAGGAIGIDSAVNIKNPSHLPTIGLFRKKAIEKAGFFDESFKYGCEDVDLTSRIKKAGYSLKCNANTFLYHKARNSMKEFVNWCFRRGIAKFHFSKNPVNLVLPLALPLIPFTKKFRLLIKRRKQIKVSLFEIFTIIFFLFFARHVLMSLGWFYALCCNK